MAGRWVGSLSLWAMPAHNKRSRAQIRVQKRKLAARLEEAWCAEPSAEPSARSQAASQSLAKPRLAHPLAQKKERTKLAQKAAINKLAWDVGSTYAQLGFTRRRSTRHVCTRHRITMATVSSSARVTAAPEPCGSQKRRRESSWCMEECCDAFHAGRSQENGQLMVTESCKNTRSDWF